MSEDVEKLIQAGLDLAEQMGRVDDPGAEVVRDLATALETAVRASRAESAQLIERLRVAVDTALGDSLTVENDRCVGQTGCEGIAAERRELEAVRDEVIGAIRERDAAVEVLDRVRSARAGHPRCDRHPDGDVVTCGWKRVVLDIDAALGAAQETAR